MKKTGWQQAWVRTLTTLLTALVMIMIFGFSRQDAAASNDTSGFISGAVISVLYRDYDTQDPEARKVIYDRVQVVVRKCAHFSEYTLLGFLIRLCLESWFGHRIRKRHTLPLTAFAGGAAYAATDEWHQKLVNGRSGEWADILLDSCGVLFGVFIANRLITVSGKRKERIPDGNEHRTGQS